MPSNVICQQFVYGKLVQEPGGAIVSLYEHQCTGKSPLFPPDLARLCHPSVTGLAPEDTFDWRLYPWRKEGGGVVSTPVQLPSGELWILVGKILGLPEKGEGKAGRIFKQGHYAAIPLSQWHPGFLPELNSKLAAAPMLAENYSLPEIQLSSDWPEEPFPQDWESRCGQLLTQLLSGEPVSIQDWDQSIAKTIETFRLCLCLLPAALAWRVTWGAGLINMDGAVALGHGMKAKDGPRIVAGKIRGIDDLNLSAGKEFVAHLKVTLDGVTKLGDVREAIDADLPGFSRVGDVPLAEDWRNAARRIGRTVLEDAQLRHFRSSEPGAAWDLSSQFTVCRDEALQVAFGRFDCNSLATLASAATPEWAPVWENAVPPDGGIPHAIAQLLGMLPITAPDALKSVRNCELPAGLRVKAVERLREAVAQSEDPRAWITLVTPCEGEARWLQDWRTAAQRDLSWLAYGPLPGNAELRAALGEAAIDQFAVGFETSESEPSDALKDLVKGWKGEVADFQALLEELGRTQPRHLCLLLEACQSDVVLRRYAAEFTEDRLNRREGFGSFVARLASDLVRFRDRIPNSAVAWLLNGWNCVPEAYQDRLRAELVQKIGKPFAFIFFSSVTEEAPNAAMDQLCRAAIARRLNTDPEFWSALARSVSTRNTDRQITSMLISFLQSTDPKTLGSMPTCQIVAGFLQTFQLDPEAPLAKLHYPLLEEIRESISPDSIPEEPLQKLSSEPLLRFTLLYLFPRNIEATPTIRQAQRILEGIIADALAAAPRWIEIVTTRDWHAKPIWRLAHFAGICRVGQKLPAMPDFKSLELAEQQTLKGLTTDAMLFLCLKQPSFLPPALLCDLDPQTLGKFATNDSRLEALINIFAEHKCHFQREQVAHFLVQRAIRRRGTLDELRKAIRKSRGLRAKAKAVLRAEPNPFNEYALIVKALRDHDDPERLVTDWWNAER